MRSDGVSLQGHGTLFYPCPLGIAEPMLPRKMICRQIHLVRRVDTEIIEAPVILFAYVYDGMAKFMPQDQRAICKGRRYHSEVS